MVERLMGLETVLDVLVVDDIHRMEPATSPKGWRTEPTVCTCCTGRKRTVLVVACAGFAWALSETTILSSRWTATSPTTRTTSRASSRRRRRRTLTSLGCAIAGHSCDQLAAEPALLSMFAGKYVRAITGMPFTDPTGGFRVSSARCRRLTSTGSRPTATAFRSS